MSYDEDAGIIKVKPMWNLAICDNVNVSDPGGMALYRPKRVAKFLRERSKVKQLTPVR